MAVSSADVIKSVSKKLKYYFDIKRLEDGFDLSGVDCPRLDHPHVKARPTLMYDGLHDKPLKHYFSPQEVRVSLTQFKAPDGKQTREKEIRKSLERHIRRYHFRDQKTMKNKGTDPALLTPSYTSQWSKGSAPTTLSRVSSAKGAGLSKPSVLSDGYYHVPNGKGSRRLRTDMTGGFGVGLRKKKSVFRGGQPILRSVPPTGISRHEAERLVNIASRLLVATETIDVTQPPVGTILKEKDGSQQAPRSSEKKYHTVYTYDINGRRILIRKAVDSEDDSAYNSPPRSTTPNYVTITGEQADDQVMPKWLRKELQRSGEESVRPHTAYTAPTPRPPDDDASRPKSAAARPLSGRRQLRRPSDPPQVKNGWDAQTNSGGGTQDDTTSTSTVETGVQTGGELLHNYQPSECVIFDGEKAQYEVHVFTGDRLGASTKADIKLKMSGDKGCTKDIHLNNSKTHKITFQRGQEDIFDLDTYFLGPLRKITIGHDRNELGYGWFLERVEVKDMTNLIKYVVPCERWLSSKETDQRTVHDFKVDYNIAFTPASPQAPESDEPPPEQAMVTYAPADSIKDTTDQSSVTSHTSTATLRGDTRTPRRRPSNSSWSSYTTPSTSYTRHRVTGGNDRPRDGQAQQSTKSKTRSDEEEARDKVQEDDIKPKAPPAMRHIRRRDTFFDQKGPGQDYTSVIDTLSQSTEQDTRERQDFEPDTPSYVAKEPGTAPLTLRDDDEDTAHLEKKDVMDPKEEEEEEERHGTRLSLPVQKEKISEEKILPSPRGSPLPKGNRKVRVDDSGPDSDSEELERGPSIHEAAKNGDLNRVKQHIEHHNNSKDSADEHGWAPIHMAASYGHVDIIKWLSVSSADLDALTPTGYTPMHLAAMQGHTNAMIVLNAMGAKLNIMSVEHQSPLHVAAKGGYLESVKWLVANRASLDAADIMGRRPVDLAEEHRQDAVYEFLKLCEKEQEGNPDGSFAMMRTDSRRSIESAGKDNKSVTTYTSDSEHSEDKGATWRDDQPAEGRSNNTGRSEDDLRKVSKHDEELMEKRAMFDDQQRRMSVKNVSFLDSIRDEAL